MNRLIAVSTAVFLAIALWACDAIQPPPESTPEPTIRAGVGIDASVFARSPALARTAYHRLMSLLEPLLQREGAVAVEVELVGRSGTAPVRLVNVELPSLDQLSGMPRKRRIISARQRLTTRLKAGFSLTRQRQGLREQIRVVGTDGSDPAGAIVNLRKWLREGERGAERRLILFSDGLQRGSGVDLASEIYAGSARPEDLAARLGPLLPEDLAGTEIELYGIGLNGRGNVTTRRSLLLERAWSSALRQAHAKPVRTSTSY
jgi:hypothetical protein